MYSCNKNKSCFSIKFFKLHVRCKMGVVAISVYIILIKQFYEREGLIPIFNKWLSFLKLLKKITSIVRVKRKTKEYDEYNF